MSADMPVAARVVQASVEEPYLALSVEVEIPVLREVAAKSGTVGAGPSSTLDTLFSEDTDDVALDCALRLIRLLDQP